MLVPLCVTPELQVIGMPVGAMLVRQLEVGGAIALVGSGSVCGRLWSIKWRDKWRIVGTRWSAEEAFGHLRRVFTTSVGMLGFPLWGILHVIEHVYTWGQAGMVQALLTNYVPGFLRRFDSG